MDAVAQDAAQALLALANGLGHSVLVSALQQWEDSLGVILGSLEEDLRRRAVFGIRSCKAKYTA